MQRFSLVVAVFAGCVGVGLLTTGSTGPVVVGTGLLGVAFVAADVDLRYTILGWLVPLLAGILMSFVVDDVQVRSALLRAGNVAASVSVVAVLGKVALAKVGGAARFVKTWSICNRRGGGGRRATVKTLPRVMSKYWAGRFRDGFNERRAEPVSGLGMARLTGVAMLVTGAVLAVPALAATAAGASGATDQIAGWQLALGLMGLILFIPTSVGSSREVIKTEQSPDDYPPPGVDA